MPYQSLKGLKGKLIALEGPDGVGRSTHIELLQEWLEVQGYGVLTTGWTRSELMSKTIASAKQGNILDPWSHSLLYATDFADRLEHQGVLLMFVPGVDLWRDVNVVRELGEAWKMRAVMPRFVLDGEGIRLIASRSGSADELAAIDEGLAQVQRGEYASDAEVDAAFRRFRK